MLLACRILFGLSGYDVIDVRIELGYVAGYTFMAPGYHTNLFGNQAMKQRIQGLLFTLLTLSLLHPLAGAADPAPFDANALEEQIKAVIEKVKPATVALFQGNDQGAGGATGVIVSKDGLILTAGHCVMKPGSKMSVLLADGREFPAVGLGMAPTVDCGLMQIEPKSLKGIELPFAEMGWSAELKVDQPCISLGHSGGYNEERGAVVRLGRIAEIASSRHGFICSTCLMEPGDSGGPLFDMHGRVIGIHSQIDRDLDKNFEVPIDIFRRYWNHLKASKKFRARNINDAPQIGWKLKRGGESFMGFGVGSGVKITQVEPDGWADSQGFQESDSVVSIDGMAVSNSNQLQILIYRGYLLKKKGVELKITRKGEKRTLKVVLEDLARDAENQQTEYRCVKKMQVEPIPQLGNLPLHFAEIESKLDDACVVIESDVDGKSKKVLGTALSLDSELWIVGKSSLVGDAPKVTAEGQKRVAAKVIARNDAKDLILLQVKTTVAGITEFDALQAKKEILTGKILITPHFANKGEVSLLGSEAFSATGSGFLGVIPGLRSGGEVFLVEVTPGSAAEKTGLLANDVIVSVAGKPIRKTLDLVKLLAKYKPGETVQVKALRDEQELHLKVKLGSRPRETEGSGRRSGRHVADAFKGGKSKVRTGFPRVFVHDANVLPRECGGPVFTTSGDFVGISIARFSRTQSYILPASEVKAFIDSATNPND